MKKYILIALTILFAHFNIYSMREKPLNSFKVDKLKKLTALNIGEKLLDKSHSFKADLVPIECLDLIINQLLNKYSKSIFTLFDMKEKSHETLDNYVTECITVVNYKSIDSHQPNAKEPEILLNINSNDNMFAIWEKSSGEVLGEFDRQCKGFEDIFHTIDHYIAYCNNPSAYQSQNIYSQALFTNNQEYLIVGCTNGTHLIFAMPKPQDYGGISFLKKFNQNKQQITSLSISPDNKYILSSTNNNTILWDLATYNYIAVFSNQDEKQTDFTAFSFDQKYILIVYNDKTFDIFNLDKEFTKISIEQTLDMIKQANIANSEKDQSKN